MGANPIRADTRRAAVRAAARRDLLLPEPPLADRWDGLLSTRPTTTSRPHYAAFVFRRVGDRWDGV